MLERLHRGPFPIEDVLEIWCQIVEGLEDAHGKGILQRDMKPSDVKVTPEGKGKFWTPGWPAPGTIRRHLAAFRIRHSTILLIYM